jgi:hypothetical protein
MSKIQLSPDDFRIANTDLSYQFSGSGEGAMLLTVLMKE